MLESNPVLNTTWHFSERLDWHLKDLLEVDFKLELPYGAQKVAIKKRVGLSWRNLSKSDRKTGHRRLLCQLSRISSRNGNTNHKNSGYCKVFSFMSIIFLIF